MSKTVLCVLSAAAALVAQGPNRCASTNAAGVAGIYGSYRPTVSTDGRYVAFQSSADDLVPNDTNGQMDVFVKDRLTGAIELASVASNGAQGNGQSTDPAISADGRFVVFASWASFSVFDNNAAVDVYRKDRLTGQITLVSCSALGIVGNDDSGRPSVSADGRFVAFQSRATNLVPGGGNFVPGVFLGDLQTAVVQCVSSAPGNQPANGGSGGPFVSGDGRWVAFDSWASNLVANDTNNAVDVFAWDRLTGSMHRVSRGPGGVQANSASEVLGISQDGQLVLYASWASNLVANDTNNCVDIFTGDQIGATAERVSVGTAGLQANGHSLTASISGNGRFVAFATDATNLVAGDFNGMTDVLLRDRQAGTTVRASKSLGGGDPSGICYGPAVENGGRYVAYVTYASNVLAIANNFTDQVIVSDLQPAVPATFTALGQGCAGSVGVPALGRDPNTLPWTGTTLRIQGDTAVGNTFGILAFGFSSTSWNGMPLPAPLSGFGMGPCTLYTSVDLTAPVFPAGNGTWQFDFAVPAGGAWVGGVMHTQCWLLDPWANNALGATVTNAATMVFGG